MAYFPNGTEGMDWEARWCDRCMHRGNPDEPSACPIQALHFEFNYDQCNKDERGKTIKDVLTLLIPMDGLYASRCSMFVEGLPEWMQTEEQQEMFMEAK